MPNSILYIFPIAFLLIISGALSSHVLQTTRAQSNTTSVAPPTTKNMNSTNLTYENPIKGIAIKYPSNWGKRESQNRTSNEIVTFISPSVSEVVDIRGGRPALNISLDQWGSAAVDVLRRSFHNFNLFVSNSTTLGGLPAHEIVFGGTIPSSGHEVKVLEIMTIKDGSRFWIAAVANPRDFSSFQSTLQKMIDSFSFSSGTAVQQPPSTSGTVNASSTNSSSPS